MTIKINGKVYPVEVSTLPLGEGVVGTVFYTQNGIERTVIGTGSNIEDMMSDLREKMWLSLDEEGEIKI